MGAALSVTESIGIDAAKSATGDKFDQIKGDRWSDGRHVAVFDDTGRTRGRGTPSDSRLPNDRSGPRVEAALRGCW